MNEIYALCRTYGPMLQLPPGCGIDGSKLMAAIAWNESSCGENLTPRHEPAYDFGGRYAKNAPQSELLPHWGSKAAYSYGPWQMMPCNAIGYTPDELAADNEKCALAFVGFFNRYIIGHMHAMTLDEIFQCYNAGHWATPPLPGVARYVADGMHYYGMVNLMATEVA